jgi:hypothetical protein
VGGDDTGPPTAACPCGVAHAAWRCRLLGPGLLDGGTTRSPARRGAALTTFLKAGPIARLGASPGDGLVVCWGQAAKGRPESFQPPWVRRGAAGRSGGPRLGPSQTTLLRRASRASFSGDALAPCGRGPYVRCHDRRAPARPANARTTSPKRTSPYGTGPRKTGARHAAARQDAV